MKKLTTICRLIKGVRSITECVCEAIRNGKQKLVFLDMFLFRKNCKINASNKITLADKSNQNERNHKCLYDNSLGYYSNKGIRFV